MVRRRLLLGGLLGGLLVSSCQLARLDLFPSYLSYAVRERKILEDFHREGLVEPVWVGRVERLTSPWSGRSVLFLYASDYQGAALFAYDPDTLKQLRTYRGVPISPLLGISPGGNYLCGGVEIEPRGLDLVSQSSPTYPYGFSNALPLFDPASSRLYLFVYSSGALTCLYFDPSGWASGTETVVGAAPVLSLSSSPGSLRDLLFPSGSDGSVRLLFVSGEGLREFRFSSPSALVSACASASSLESAAVSTTLLPGIEDQSGAWLLRGGTVRLSRDQKNSLVRYGESSTGERDRWELEEDTRGAWYHFFDAGDRWLYFDGEAQTLRLLRTWW